MAQTLAQRFCGYIAAQVMADAAFITDLSGLCSREFTATHYAGLTVLLLWGTRSGRSWVGAELDRVSLPVPRQRDAHGAHASAAAIGRERMYHQFTRIEAENILRSSENQPTSYAAPASLHMRARFTCCSAMPSCWSDMRRCRKTRSGGTADGAGVMYTLITAFCALPDMIDAAERVLNSRQSQAALADFFLNTPQGPGMRAEICYTSDIDYTMRYAQGWTAVRTMPVRDLVMVLDRVDGRPFRLQIQTFFGTLQDISRTPPRSSCRTANPTAPISCRRGRSAVRT